MTYDDPLLIYKAYVDWLYEKILFKEMKKAGRNYSKMLGYIQSRQFTWVLDFDANRAEDGKYLRITFRNETGLKGDIKGSCTFLEMAIALAMRMSDDLFSPDPSASPARFFWIMMENCGLDRLTDDIFDEAEAREIVDRILNRTFTTTGYGGFFPLKKPKKDQRKVELWYMMQQYVQENYEF